MRPDAAITVRRWGEWRVSTVFIVPSRVLCNGTVQTKTNRTLHPRGKQASCLSIPIPSLNTHCVVFVCVVCVCVRPYFLLKKHFPQYNAAPFYLQSKKLTICQMW